jgi:hypothetical protein
MPGHLDPQRRQIKNLPPLDSADRPSLQQTTALPAAARLMHDLMIRLGHLPQRLANMAVLPARLATGLLPQRPRPRRGLA